MSAVAQSLGEALSAVFGRPKVVARAAGCSQWTAQRYIRGESMPDAAALVRLIQKKPEMAEVLLRLAGLDDRALLLQKHRLCQDLIALDAARMSAHDAMVEAHALVAFAAAAADGAEGDAQVPPRGKTAP